ncbi:hypothetical protein [Cohnella pontilimi]|nr:hypothetical protein [Cohnella pontilimi]
MQTLEASLTQTDDTQQHRIDRLEDQIMLLEWVLNEPAGKYHS